MKYVISLLPLLAVLTSSCVQLPPPYPTSQTNASAPSAQQKKEVRWNLRPNQTGGWDLDAIVNGQTRKVGSGGEYFNNKVIAPGTEGIPSSALSGYQVPGPDGELMVFYAQQLGGTVQVFSRYWNPNPMDGPTGFGNPELVATF